MNMRLILVGAYLQLVGLLGAGLISGAIFVIGFVALLAGCLYVYQAERRGKE